MDRCAHMSRGASILRGRGLRLRRVAAGCGDRTVRVWAAADGKSARVLRLHADWVQAVAFSPDGARLLTASRDRTARMIDLASGEVATSYTGHDAPLLGAGFSPDGTQAWTLARSGAMHRWDAGRATRSGELKGAEWTLFRTAAAGMLAVAGDHKLRFYQGADRTPAATWEAGGSAVQALAISPDAKLGASGAADGTVAVFTLPEGKPLKAWVAAPR